MGIGRGLAMIEYPTLITPLVTLFAGYFCTKQPFLVARLMTSWLPEAREGHMNQSQEMAKYIRDSPEHWPQKYPVFYRRIKLLDLGHTLSLLLAS